MSTEDALRERVASAQLSPDGDGFAGCVGYYAADAALGAFGYTSWREAADMAEYKANAALIRKAAALIGALPEAVLSWCRANRDTAAALAAGTMVGVPKEPSDDVLRRVSRATKTNHYLWPSEIALIWRMLLAAVSPPTSDEGLGGKP